MSKKLIKSLLFSGLGLVGTAVILLGVVKVVADRQTAKMDEIAAAYLKQFPAVSTNASARKLDRLNASLGISPTDPSDTKPLVDQKKAEAMSAIQEQLREYLERQGQKTSAPLEPVPSELMEFLKQYETELEAIKQHLVTAEVAVWELDPEIIMADFSYALPRFVNLANLNKLFLVEAIAYNQAQKPMEMLQSLKIAQQLQDPLNQRPNLLSYLVELIMVKDQVAILRHLDEVPVEIADSLLAVNRQETGLQALNFEAWMTYGYSQKVAARTAKNSERLEDGYKLHPFSRDYSRLAATDTVRAMNAYHQELAKFNACSPPDAIELGDEAVAWWNLNGKDTHAMFGRQRFKGDLRMLELELTQKILQAKAQKKDGKWPEQLSNLESQVCPGEMWIYELTPEGRLSLRFSHEFEDPEKRGYMNLPLQYQG